MEENTLVTTRMVSFMDLVLTHGPKVESIKANTRMTFTMESEFIFGPTVKSTMESGTQTSNTVLESLQTNIIKILSTDGLMGLRSVK